MDRHHPQLPQNEYYEQGRGQYYDPNHYYGSERGNQYPMPTEPDKKRGHKLQSALIVGALVASASVFAYDNYPDRVLSARYAVSDFIGSDQPCADEGLGEARNAVADWVSGYDSCKPATPAKHAVENS